MTVPMLACSGTSPVGASPGTLAIDVISIAEVSSPSAFADPSDLSMDIRSVAARTMASVGTGHGPGEPGCWASLEGGVVEKGTGYRERR